MLKIKSFQVDRLLVTGKHTSLLLERINFHKPHVASAAQAVFAVAFLPASAALHLHKKKKSHDVSNMAQNRAITQLICLQLGSLKHTKVGVKRDY